MNVKNGNIYHKRGDTADFDINLTVDGEDPGSYSAIFSVKTSPAATDYLFQKTVVDGHVRIDHSDTQALAYGDYYYDVQVVLNDGSDEGCYITVGPFRYYLMADVTTG